MENFLSSADREKLKLMHRSEKDGRTRDRIKAVLLSDKGWSYNRIAEALLLDSDTVSRHVDEYCKRAKLHIETGGSSGKLNADQRQALILHIEETTYLKVCDICDYVEKRFGVKYSVAGMTSWLKHHGFSYKKPKPTPSKADPEKQAAFIKYYEELLNTTAEDEPILFIDGVHPTMATKVSYGWIKKGKDKLIATAASRTRLNLMGALNLETMRVDVKSYETLDSDAMADYWLHLKSLYPNAPKIHIVLDRGPYNLSCKTKEAAEKCGIILHPLPAYSPNLNPIERVWKVMNEHVRNNRFFTSAKEFRQSIMHFFDHTWDEIADTLVDRVNDNFQTIQKPAFSF